MGCGRFLRRHRFKPHCGADRVSVHAFFWREADQLILGLRTLPGAGITRFMAVDVEYWPTPDPILASGNREQIMDVYREVRDGLFAKIEQRVPSRSDGARAGIRTVIEL